MKKNITINLCGRLYQIDEDAYELLSHYTETLRNYFLKQEGGKEIADDIEERVAELLDDLKAQGIEAITIEHVQDIIHRIGQVEEIAGEEATTSTDSSQAEDSTDGHASSSKGTQEGATVGKKFYRDSQNKMVAGVLAGCAQYFGGDVSVWRWGYAAVCLLWWVFNGVAPFSVGHIFALPIMLFVAPIALFPLVPYLLVAIFAPETKNPEDVLKMKGKEVNAQNLVVEVQEHTAKKKEGGDGSQFWNIFVGVISIGVSTFLTIGFIVALCFFVAFVAASEMMADNWWNIDEVSVLNAIGVPVVICGILLLTSIGILLYCSIHAAVSSFGKTPSMSTRQRILWFLLWVASLAGFVGSVVYAMGKYNKANHLVSEKRWKEEQAWKQSHTHGRFVFNDDDWNFFQENGWRLTDATHIDRYTYSGEYMTGDEDVRYLDACNWNEPFLYSARKSEQVEPGIYRLSAAVRASHAGMFIFLWGHLIDPEGNYVPNYVEEEREIPSNGNEVGNIWEVLALQRGDVFLPADPKTANDPLLKELVLHRIPAEDHNAILDANDGDGYGWNYVYIDSVRVDQPSEITYGVSNNLENRVDVTGWFSATDFKLERIGDLSSKQ